jgi:hypothetical protein
MTKIRIDELMERIILVNLRGCQDREDGQDEQDNIDRQDKIDEEIGRI